MSNQPLVNFDDTKNKELIQIISNIQNIGNDLDVSQWQDQLNTVVQHLSPEVRKSLITSLLTNEKEPNEAVLSYRGKVNKSDLLGNPRVPSLKVIQDYHGEGTIESEWVNRLVLGDNLDVLQALIALKNSGKFKNADGSDGVRCCYIDPPFATQRDFKSTTGDLAYTDKQAGSEFYEFLRQRLILIHDLLADDGSLYVHLDANTSHYVKVLLDEIFGKESFQREIIWRIGWVSGYKSKVNNWVRNHDVILYYVKNPKNFIFNKSYIPYPQGYVRRDGKPPKGKGYPIEDTWNCNPIDELNSIQIMSFSREKTGYPTQKNEALISRIITASSNPGDIVLDCFVGSGTTIRVAEKTGRRWVGIDVGELSINTTVKRILTYGKDTKTPMNRFIVLQTV